MRFNIKTVSTPQTRQFTGGDEIAELEELAQYSLLAELPGLIFGLMTLVYVVSSLWLLG